MQGLRNAICALAALLLADACGSAGPAHAPGPPAALELRLLAVNDFHGNLENAAALAQTLARLRAGHEHALLVSAGDLVGASPLPSALAHDEPTLALFDHLGLLANAIGNHELDGGIAALRRQQARVAWPFLSANLVDARTGQPVFPAYRIVEIEGIRIALVGATVRNALAPLEPALVPDLRIDDEASAINAQVAQLRARGVRAIVVLLHEGAEVDGALSGEDCAGLRGPARDIAGKLDPAVDAVLSAHSHKLYACRLGGRWLTQAGANGAYVTALDLRIDPRSGRVLDAQAENFQVRADESPGDPFVRELVAAAVAAAAKVASAPVGRIRGGRVSAAADAGGGSPLGRLVARAQLAAGARLGAQLACINPSSVPRDLVASGPYGMAIYADVRAVQPYGNRLELREAKGAQLRQLLEQQWRGRARPALLSCSPGLEYRVRDGQVTPSSLRLHGRQLADDDKVLILVNSYLARGGEDFGALVGTPTVGEAGGDLDALLAWLRSGAAK